MGELGRECSQAPRSSARCPGVSYGGALDLSKQIACASIQVFIKHKGIKIKNKKNEKDARFKKTRSEKISLWSENYSNLFNMQITLFPNQFVTLHLILLTYLSSLSPTDICDPRTRNSWLWNARAEKNQLCQLGDRKPLFPFPWTRAVRRWGPGESPIKQHAKTSHQAWRSRDWARSFKDPLFIMVSSLLGFSLYLIYKAVKFRIFTSSDGIVSLFSPKSSGKNHVTRQGHAAIISVLVIQKHLAPMQLCSCPISCHTPSSTGGLPFSSQT